MDSKKKEFTEKDLFRTFCSGVSSGISIALIGFLLPPLSFACHDYSLLSDFSPAMNPSTAAPTVLSRKSIRYGSMILFHSGDVTFHFAPNTAVTVTPKP